MNQVTENLKKMREIAAKASSDARDVIADYDAQRGRTFTITITEEQMCLLGILVCMFIVGALQ